MDAQQLKLLAGRVRDLLAQHNHLVVHGQALDLIAALPGLRNWSEVMAFPARVAECRLSESPATRLAYRLKSRFGLDIETPALLQILDPSQAVLPELWPTGPEPGVYVTASQDAINALTAQYAEATDGAALYAERAGLGADGAIDLGEHGLWSSGLDRVPSGTLLVIGPLNLAQDEWDRNAERLEMACLHAYNSGHRVAVLFEAMEPDEINHEAVFLVKEKDPDGDLDTMLKGIVGANGEMVRIQPFVQPLEKPIAVPNPEPLHSLPSGTSSLLSEALAISPFGILVVGSSLNKANRAELLETLLPLTDAAGPVARIIPSLRAGYDPEPNLSERFQNIPVCSSVASAYARGYRRMVIEQAYSASDDIKQYAGEVCLLLGTWATTVGDAFCQAIRPADYDKPEILSNLIAVLGVEEIPTKTATHAVADLFVYAGQEPPTPSRFSDVIAYLNDNRVLRVEDGVHELLTQGEVSAAQIKKAVPRNQAILDVVATWKRSKTTQTA